MRLLCLNRVELFTGREAESQPAWTLSSPVQLGAARRGAGEFPNPRRHIFRGVFARSWEQRSN